MYLNRASLFGPTLPTFKTVPAPHGADQPTEALNEKTYTAAEPGGSDVALCGARSTWDRREQGHPSMAAVVAATAKSATRSSGSTIIPHHDPYAGAAEGGAEAPQGQPPSLTRISESSSPVRTCVWWARVIVMTRRLGGR